MFSKPRNLGKTLLCVWLIAFGAMHLLGMGRAVLMMLLHVVAIAAGVLMWLDR